MNSRNKKRSQKKGSKRRSPAKKGSRRRSTYTKKGSRRRSYRKWEIATNTFDTNKYTTLDKGSMGEQYMYVVYLMPYNPDSWDTRLNAFILGIFTKVEKAKTFLIDLINNRWDPVLMHKDDKEGTLTVAQIQIDYGLENFLEEVLCGRGYGDNKDNCPGIILFQNEEITTNKIKNDTEFKTDLINQIKKIEATNAKKEQQKREERENKNKGFYIW